MKLLTNLFRALGVLMVVFVVMLNSTVTLKINPIVSAVLTFLTCLFIELSMLFQTIKNREENSCRQNFGYKLMFVSALMIFSSAVFFIELL